MAVKSYNLFCPLAMACELLEPRWTLLILAEMADGSTRFNEIRRGVPGISPTLLSRRLKEMEAKGMIERLEDRANGTVDYVLTPLARDLEPIMESLGDWSYRNLKASVALDDPNPDYLMWQIRRTLDPTILPHRRVVIRFRFSGLADDISNYWLITKPGMPVDLCMSDPGFDVDLFVETEFKALASAWMRYTSPQHEMSMDRIYLSGDPVLARAIEALIGQCPFAEAAE